VSPEKLVRTPLTAVNGLHTAVLSADRDDPLGSVYFIVTVVEEPTELTLVVPFNAER
jgi:hypothetical protein